MWCNIEANSFVRSAIIQYILILSLPSIIFTQTSKTKGKKKQKTSGHTIIL